ncbi:jg7572 [Pararge aegeria aegeria]|uniref:Jg7572 protein n=1 Tax=Pararge aegeria aegeria TaxID=348720 RepID=A0A8S4QH89_9NEOP|nr:jg7572 [Pararge aegeria aegeria]
MECAGCKNILAKSRNTLQCSTCDLAYDLLCANVSEKKYGLMSTEHKLSWTCHGCRSKQPRSDNSNTPIRPTNIAPAHPNISPAETDTSNITRRKKTKEVSPILSSAIDPSIMNAIKFEIQSAVKNSVKAAIDSFFSREFDQIKSELKKLNDLKESVEFLTSEYDRIQTNIKDSEEKIKNLTLENTNLNKSLESLSTRLILLEQHSRENNLEINGIPENKSENLYSVLNQLGVTISLPIQESDIIACTRVRKLDDASKRPRTVVVKLRNTRVRDSIIAAVSKFNKNKSSDRLNSSHLGYSVNKSFIYVSEHLSPYYKALHVCTRTVAKERGIRYVWIRNGRILIRKNDQSPAKQIKCYETLKNL